MISARGDEAPNDPGQSSYSAPFRALPPPPTLSSSADELRPVHTFGRSNLRTVYAPLLY